MDKDLTLFTIDRDKKFLSPLPEQLVGDAQYTFLLLACQAMPIITKADSPFQKKGKKTDGSVGEIANQLSPFSRSSWRPRGLGVNENEKDLEKIIDSPFPFSFIPRINSFRHWKSSFHDASCFDDGPERAYHLPKTNQSS